MYPIIFPLKFLTCYNNCRDYIHEKKKPYYYTVENTVWKNIDDTSFVNTNLISDLLTSFKNFVLELVYKNKMPV